MIELNLKPETKAIIDLEDIKEFIESLIMDEEEKTEYLNNLDNAINLIKNKGD